MFGKLVSYFNGRHTLFAVYFAGMGTVLAWKHALDPNFVALCTALQGMILAHSYKEGKEEMNAVSRGNPNSESVGSQRN